MGWGGVGTLTVFCTCTHVRFYTLGRHHMGWGGVGWGCWRSFALAHMWGSTLWAHITWDGVGWGWWRSFALAHMWDSTLWARITWDGVGWGRWCETLHFGHASHGMGWGGDKFLHIERKITSLVHSHPPSHYICKHVLLPTTWILMMFVHYPPFPHIFSWKLIFFGAWASFAQVLAAASPFFPFDTHMRKLLGQHISFFQLWNFLVIPPRRVFPWEKKQDPAGAGSITCEFTLTCEPKTHCTWENTMKVNLRNVAGFLQRAFSLKKTRNVGAVGRESYKFTITFNARRVLLEKTHGIWKGFRDGRFSWKKIWNPGAVGRVSYEFTVTVNARRSLPEKTQGIWGGWYSAHFSLKNTTISPGLARVTCKFTVEMKPRRILHEKHNDFSAVGGSDM